MEPNILHQGSTSLVIALSETEVGKVLFPPTYKWVDANTHEPVDILGDSEPTWEKELANLVYANTINDLLPKFIRRQIWTDENQKEHSMIVMERLYPLPHYHFAPEIRAEMLKTFKQKLEELHDKGFAHGDVMRPTTYFTRNNYQWMFGNVIQTTDGLRMIDTGFSQIKSLNKDRRGWYMKLYYEKRELDAFEEYYLSEIFNRPSS